MLTATSQTLCATLPPPNQLCPPKSCLKSTHLARTRSCKQHHWLTQPRAPPSRSSWDALSTSTWSCRLRVYAHSHYTAPAPVSVPTATTLHRHQHQHQRHGSRRPAHFDCEEAGGFHRFWPVYLGVHAFDFRHTLLRYVDKSECLY